MEKYNILDLFCGAGGFSRGLDSVDGFKTVVAIDFNKDAVETFRHNFPYAYCIHGDITDKDVKKNIIDKSKEKKVNMIIGGPPCQGFSNKGKKMGLDDERNFLFLEYVDIVDRVKPDVFIIENVKGIISSGKGYFIKQIYEKFESLGYSLSHEVLNSADYGVPQTRERAIIVGVKGKNSIDLKTIEKSNQVTVRDAISDLSYLSSGSGEYESEYVTFAESEYQNLMRGNSKSLFHHQATNHSKLAIEKLKMIPAEGDKSSLPKELHGNQKFKTTWARLIWDKPSPTIDTRFDTPSNGRNSHPELHRAITPREAARIQSFDDAFIFKGKKVAICKQIGNAVPPLMARAIGKHIKKELERK